MAPADVIVDELAPLPLAIVLYKCMVLISLFLWTSLDGDQFTTFSEQRKVRLFRRDGMPVTRTSTPCF
jgi:hypothetical protein